MTKSILVPRHVPVCLAAMAGLLVSTSVYAQTATGQSPMLEPRVQSGELPPVAERVGEEPLALVPTGDTRSYGGDLKMIYSGPGDETWLNDFYGYEGLVSWTSTVDGIKPNVAQAWEVNEDATSFTIDLRRGMRWSDGTPFTAEDVAFWANHVQNNEDIDPDFRAPFILPEDNLKAEVLDDETVRLSFASTKALLMLQLAGPSGRAPVAAPKHYLSQYHIDFNASADEEAKAAGYQNWAERYNLMADPWTNPELPTIMAWEIVTPADDPQLFTLARNPYYWKIDDEGNQLPYIDSSTVEVVENLEVMLLKALNGEVDFIGRYINVEANRPVMIENEERAGLEFFELVMARATEIQIHPNQTHPNPTLRAFFGNRDVRVAMSHAIDRQEIIDLIYAGRGEPHQVAPHPEETAFYDAEMGKQYTEYDPDLANQLLDAAGYDQRDANGWRMSPDGQPLSIIMTVRGDRQPYVDMAPFIAEDWQEVGLNVQWRALDNAAKNAFRDGNQHDIVIDDGDGASMGTYMFPRAYVPLHNDGAWGTGWVHWVNGSGCCAEEPPAHIMKSVELYRQMQQEPDLERQADIYRQILAQAKANFNQIGLSLPESRFGAYRSRLQNVPAQGRAGNNTLAFPGPMEPETFAIVDE